MQKQFFVGNSVKANNSKLRHLSPQRKNIKLSPVEVSLSPTFPTERLHQTVDKVCPSEVRIPYVYQLVIVRKNQRTKVRQVKH